MRCRPSSIEAETRHGSAGADATTAGAEEVLARADQDKPGASRGLEHWLGPLRAIAAAALLEAHPGWGREQPEHADRLRRGFVEQLVRSGAISCLRSFDASIDKHPGDSRGRAFAQGLRSYRLNG